MSRLSVQDLCKSFGGIRALDGASFRIDAPGIYGLIGPNGAGKTTLFNLITGDLKADAGSIKLFGTEMIHMGVHQRTHLSLARTYQIITLFNKDSLMHNVVLSLMGLSPTRANIGWNQASVCRMLATTFRCSNVAPLETPVVPPVYCKKATSSGASADAPPRESRKLVSRPSFQPAPMPSGWTVTKPSRAAIS